MHLLDTQTKQLKTFYGEEIPEYAILSHMWGREEDEVLFKHITGSYAKKLEGKMRKGYAKIEGACNQAVKDGWKYIWIDTCCIDKTSSAELSEAINSMYEWYLKSEVCYVYLEDVGSGGQSDENTMFPIVPFENSRWFSRGWTLQELIAPEHVVFYSKDWIDIGTKIGLRDTISTVTRIRVEMLMEYNPTKASVAEKMSWAAFRKTTRAEDAAYCMMGLLGVNMPLLYGEGNRAFMRLQEEIMKVSDDNSIFAWKCHFNKNQLYERGGMLATSPWDFREGVSIVQSGDGAYSPYAMTNQGLQIKLPLVPIEPSFRRNLIGLDSENIFKATLKCTLRDKGPPRWIVIYLEQVREGYYQRILSHWLDETETSPDETKLTSLLVPQANTLTSHDRSKYLNMIVEILPTICGFTVRGHSLVGGYKEYPDYLHEQHQVVYFEHKKKKKQFGVVIGLAMNIPWLDFINVIDEEHSFKKSYEEGGLRAHIADRHLDMLLEKIPGEDWWVTVSVRKCTNEHNYASRPPTVHFSCFRTVIDIRRVPIQAKRSYISPGIPVSDSNSGDFPDNHNYYNVHPDFKKEGHDWVAIFNPMVKRTLDVSLVYTFMPTSLVHCVRFSYDDEYLAIGGDMVKVYDVETGAEICTLLDELTETTTIFSICFSLDSKFVATGDFGGCIKLWDISARHVHKDLNGHLAPIESLCYSPDGHCIISGSRDGTVRVWNIADDTSKILIMPPGHDHRIGIGSIAISPNGSLVAAGDLKGTIRIWDMMTTRLLEELSEHGDGVHIAFTPDGKRLVSGSSDETLKYWDVSGLAPTGAQRRVEYSSNSGASSVLAESDAGKIKKHTMTFTGYKRPVTSVAISHDGRWAISGFGHGHASVLFWDSKDATAQFILETRLYSSHHSFGMGSTGNIFATVDDPGPTDDLNVTTIRVWRYNNK